MPNKYGGDPKVTEEQRAETSRIRGQVAAGMADPEARRKFIAEQGTNRLTDQQLRDDAYSQRNQNAVSDVLPKMHSGGTVPKTGAYTLEKGEKVLTEKQAKGAGMKHATEYAEHKLGAARHEGSASHAGEHHQAEGAGTHPGAEGHKKIKKMSIEPGHSGGYIVRHEHHQPEQMGPQNPVHHEDETHVVPTLQALHEHMDQHLGGGEEQGEAGGGAGEGAESASAGAAAA